MSVRTYEESGVSIERGDAFASYIASIGSGAIGDLGGFAGGVELDLSGMRHPVLLSATDGVGTKLLVARRLGRYDTVGIDLVAMCVNDLAVCGAQPSVFLDYIACGQIRPDTLEQVIRGVVAGCEQADCTLAGGETAELPDMYGQGEIDLAGFAVGLVERDERLPRMDAIREGDRVVGLRSSGVHSNGFSLARKVLERADDPVWNELLEPTRIYVRQLMAARRLIKAAAHITGGGLEANLMRVVPSGLSVSLSWDWSFPAIFDRIRTEGSIETGEMRRVFNMGVGIAMIVAEERLDELAAAVGEPLVELGSVTGG